MLCIVEAMKLMNEIETDAAGEIVKRFVKNGQPVEYGQKLFAVRPRRFAIQGTSRSGNSACGAFVGFASFGRSRLRVAGDLRNSSLSTAPIASRAASVEMTICVMRDCDGAPVW